MPLDEQFSFWPPQVFLKGLTAGVVSRARQTFRRVRSVEPQVQHQYRLPEFPPGVKPEGEENKGLAMDDAFSGDGNVFSWAAGFPANNLIAQGYTFPGFQYLAELAQIPEYRAISDVIASEMTREWIELESTGEDTKDVKIKALYAAMEHYDLRGVFQKAAALDGFFGRGHIYADTGDTDEPDELRTPLGDGRDFLSEMKLGWTDTLEDAERKKRNKGRLQGFQPVEAMWTYPTQYNSNNPLKPDWYKPKTWFVMGTEVHSSRLLTFIGRPVPDILKPAYAFGGLSMSQMAQPYVNNWLRTRQSVADIVHSFSVMVLMTDLQALLQQGGEQLFVRAELFNNLRDNQSLMMLDKNSEEFKNVSASLAGLDLLQAQTQEHMCAVSRVPNVKLLGIQPAGLNATSEGELRAFYDWIAAFQELLFRFNLTACLGFIQLSEFGFVDKDINFKFKSLWQLDEAGESAVQKTKADTDDAYIAMGAVTAEEVRERLASDPESPYHGLDLSQPLPELAPMEGMGNLLDPDQNPGTPKPSDPHDRSESETAEAANFGGSITGGFGGDVDESMKDLPADVGYQVAAKDYDHCCAACVNFMRPHACELVAGEISPVGWCRLFEPMQMQDAA